jgi:hypothetical protein
MSFVILLVVILAELTSAKRTVLILIAIVVFQGDVITIKQIVVKETVGGDRDKMMIKLVGILIKILVKI